MQSVTRRVSRPFPLPVGFLGPHCGLRPIGIGALSAGLLLAGCGSQSPTGPRSALLITLDTTRPDALSLGGGPAGLTPHIDALAREGVFFEQAFSVAPLTHPAHTSILTGLWPPQHGIRDNGISSLAPEAQTLAEVARGEGFQTAACVAAVVLDRAYGLDQGFDVYLGPDHEGSGQDSHTGEDRADVVVDRALAWLSQRDRDRPFFLWVHLFDPHAPYAPPERYRPRPTGGPNGRIDPRHLYFSEIAFADAQVGRLLQTLRAEGSLEDVAVAVVGDHGEAFGEHGEPTHGAFVWDTTLRVPLILRIPGADGAGSRSRELASVVDLYPTLLAAMGLKGETLGDGLDLMAGPVPADRGIYFESYSAYLTFGWSHLAGWRTRSGKYVHSSRPQFFNVETDPLEEHDLLASPREGNGPAIDLAPFQRALQRIGAQPGLAHARAPQDSSLLEDLRGLGYAGLGSAGDGMPAPLSSSERIAPQDSLDVYVEGLRAQEAANGGDFERAITLLKPLLREQPENPFVLDRLSTCLIRLGRHGEAIPFLKRLLRVGPGWPGPICNLGLAYYHTGQDERALEQLERAVELAPEEDYYWRALITVLEGLGRDEEAQLRRSEWDATH